MLLFVLQSTLLIFFPHQEPLSSWLGEFMHLFFYWGRKTAPPGVEDDMSELFFRCPQVLWDFTSLNIIECHTAIWCLIQTNTVVVPW